MEINVQLRHQKDQGFLPDVPEGGDVGVGLKQTRGHLQLALAVLQPVTQQRGHRALVQLHLLGPGGLLLGGLLLARLHLQPSVHFAGIETLLDS